MNAVVDQALTRWGLEGAEWRLIAARENRVFRVDQGDKSFALRLHRRNYRTDAELWSELEWMGQADKGGLHVPAPIRSLSGEFLHVIEGVQVDVLTWLSGAPIGKTGEALAAPDRIGLFRNIGQQMARLHNISDDWAMPDGFVRCSWNREGLLGETPLWGRFWDNPTLSSEELILFQKIREDANARLQAIETSLDYGLIHADLVRENVMRDGDTLQFIDFDDAGFGFRLFDLATTLIKNRGEPDYAELKAALIDGYRSQRPIDLDNLDLFILLRALTYVGWIITRMHEDGSTIRNGRFVRNAKELAEEFLLKERI